MSELQIEILLNAVISIGAFLVVSIGAIWHYEWRSKLRREARKSKQQVNQK